MMSVRASNRMPETSSLHLLEEKFGWEDNFRSQLHLTSFLFSSQKVKGTDGSISHFQTILQFLNYF